MSDLINIEDLKKEFLEKTKTKDLKAFAESQHKLIEKLLSENKSLQEKNKHLEQIVVNYNKKHINSTFTPEELICIEQISLLKSKSANRELSLEEAKKLDLFIKNLKLIQESNVLDLNKDDYSTIQENELVAIARKETSN